MTMYTEYRIRRLDCKSSYEDEVYETNMVHTLIPVLVRDCSLKLVKQSSRDHAALTDAEFRIYEWNGAGTRNMQC